jgi:4-amino-4-deoxy-L-arabinose transferase-like glycosyltransferase
MKFWETANLLKIRILIILTASLLFVPFLGAVHLFDWDEINFAESAREMIAAGDFLNVKINFELFWEKPPLFIWMQVISMKIFGINEFAARFPNALLGVITLLILFEIGRKFYDTRMSLFWVLAYAGSILPHFYFKSGIIDPWFNLFIFLSIVFFIRFLTENQKQKKIIAFSAVFLGLAVMTKGPAAILIFGLSGFVFLILKKFRMKISITDILIFIAVLTTVGGFWFILQAAFGNYNVLHDFIMYQIRLFQTKDAGHGGFLGYHFVVLFFGVFPASVFALKSFRKGIEETDNQKLFRQWMMILFWVVLILFTIVKTKIVHYSSLCYFPLTFLAALAVYQTEKGNFRASKIISGLLIFVAFVFGFAVSALQIIAANKEKIRASGIIKDDFAVANLAANPHWNGFEFLIGLILIVGIPATLIIFRKNYTKKIITIFILTLIFTNLSMTDIVPKIEQYSQNAALEFYQKHQNENAYIETYGFKSYAHLFYTQKKQSCSYPAESNSRLLTEKTDKTCYFVMKITSEKEFAQNYPAFKKLYDKNGFSFYRKEKDK